MKKVVGFLIIILIIIFGFWYARKNNKAPAETTTLTYRNSNLGINFTYPKTLSASSTSAGVTIHHEVPFEHHDYCDFKGEATTTIPTLTDFNLKMHVVNKNLVDTMRTESPYIPSENFVNGAVVPSPGFIDPFDTGTYKGFAIFEGAEGCGQTIYYLKISDSKTLVATNELITVFSGAIDVENMNAALAVPGVIDKTENENYLLDILKTVSVN